MISDKFEFKLLSLHWVENMDEQVDLCAHGELFVKIGNEILCDADTFSITLSSAALHLMRSLAGNYTKDDYSSQLLPCCGFNFFAQSEKDDVVNIMGCPSGIDWTIIHTTNNKVRHITENGNEVEMDFEDYKTIVLDFADNIEAFYRSALPKNVSAVDKENRLGYAAFWNEWHKLRNAWK